MYLYMTFLDTLFKIIFKTSLRLYLKKIVTYDQFWENIYGFWIMILKGKYFGYFIFGKLFISFEINIQQIRITICCMFCLRSISKSIVLYIVCIRMYTYICIRRFKTIFERHAPGDLKCRFLTRDSYPFPFSLCSCTRYCR